MSVLGISLIIVGGSIAMVSLINLVATIVELLTKEHEEPNNNKVQAPLLKHQTRKD